MEHSDPRVEVTVAYELSEYQQVLRDFLPLQYQKSGKTPNPLLPWNWPVVHKLLFAMVVPLIFRLKQSRVGECLFTFSEQGLSRTSKGHTASRGWVQVKIVHRLSTAYLIELVEGGAMPVPFRVFTAEQQQLFENFSRRVGQVAAAS